MQQWRARVVCVPPREHRGNYFKLVAYKPTPNVTPSAIILRLYMQVKGPRADITDSTLLQQH